MARQDAQGDVDGVSTRHVRDLAVAHAAFTPEQRAEVDAKRRETYDEKRVRAQQDAESRREKAREMVEQAYEDAIESDQFADKTNEELADLVVKRSAKVVLNGGPLFFPTTLKEVTENAKVWSNIAVQEANRRRGKLATEPVSSPVQDVAERMKALRLAAAKRAGQRGA